MPASTPASPDARERVLAATVACAGRVGLARLTVDGVAVESGVSRASVYRWFPGGRDQLVDEAITWEVGRFLRRLAAAVADGTDLSSRLALALGWAHRALADHEVLQHVLRTEPGVLLPHLRATSPIVLAVIRDYLAPLLADEALRPGVDPVEAADYLARMFLTFIGTPGAWDLSDPAVVDELVRDRLLAGVLAPSPPGGG